MSPKQRITIVKKKNCILPNIHTEIELVSCPNRWTAVVRSWIVESQKERREEVLPAFNSLFKESRQQRL
jgi:hypothetical protein